MIPDKSSQWDISAVCSISWWPKSLTSGLKCHVVYCERWATWTFSENELRPNNSITRNLTLPTLDFIHLAEKEIYNVLLGIKNRKLRNIQPSHFLGTMGCKQTWCIKMVEMHLGLPSWASAVTMRRTRRSALWLPEEVEGHAEESHRSLAHLTPANLWVDKQVPSKSAESLSQAQSIAANSLSTYRHNSWINTCFCMTLRFCSCYATFFWHS